jgi:glycosyltransferase involved in cell wall biosynthesis
VPTSLRSRVHFLPPQEAALLNDVLSAGDAALVTLGAQCAGLMTPSKIYPLLAAGRPILYVGPASGRVGQLCSTEPIGERVDNGDAPALVAALLRLASDPVRCAALGRHARHLAETRFDRPLTSARHAQLLSSIVSSSPPRSAP